MKTNSRGTRAFLLLIPLLHATVVCGQTAPAASDTTPLYPITSWRIELIQVERRLALIEARTLEDPQLGELNQFLGQELQAAMAEADPGLPEALAGVEEISRRLAEAERAGDEASIDSLTAEIHAIERRFQEARAAALQRQEIADRVAVFHAVLRRKMMENDPDAAWLLERYEALQKRLAESEAAMSQ